MKQTTNKNQPNNQDQNNRGLLQFWQLSKDAQNQINNNQTVIDFQGTKYHWRWAFINMRLEDSTNNRWIELTRLTDEQKDEWDQLEKGWNNLMEDY